MNIVLDTNVIGADWYLRGINFGLLERYLKQSDTRLFVPEIIVLETKNLFKRKLRPLVTNMAKLRGYLPEEPALRELLDIDEKCSEYDAELDKRLAELNAEMPNHSDVPHDSIVARALALRRPFKEKDRGYRDTLLWEVILRKIAAKDTTTFFVSSNHLDFADKQTGSVLHADLAEDLISAGLPRDSVQYYSSLGSFIDEQVKGKLKVTVDDVLRELKEDSYEGFSFNKWFSENRDEIIAKINEKTDSAFDYTSFGDLEDPTVTYVEDPSKTEVLEVTQYEGEEGLYHIEVYATLDVTVDVFVQKSTYYGGLSDRVPLAVCDGDWNKWCIWAQIEELELSVSFSLVFDASQKTVENFEVNEVGEIWGWCRFCGAQVLSEAAEECWSCGKSFGWE